MTGNITFAQAITVPAGTNLLMVFWNCSAQAGGAVAGPNFNGVGLSTYVDFGNSKDYIWYLKNPPIGTYNLNLAYNSLTSGCAAFTTGCFGNVDMTTPFSGWISPGSYNGGSTVTTAAFASVANGLAVETYIYKDRTASGKTVGYNSPAALISYRSVGWTDSTGSSQGTFTCQGYTAGTGSNVTITAGFPYGPGTGPYYFFNLLPAQARGRSSVIFF